MQKLVLVQGRACSARSHAKQAHRAQRGSARGRCSLPALCCCTAGAVLLAKPPSVRKRKYTQGPAANSSKNTAQSSLELVAHTAIGQHSSHLDVLHGVVRGQRRQEHAHQWEGAGMAPPAAARARRDKSVRPVWPSGGCAAGSMGGRGLRRMLRTPGARTGRHAGTHVPACGTGVAPFLIIAAFASGFAVAFWPAARVGPLLHLYRLGLVLFRWAFGSVGGQCRARGACGGAGGVPRTQAAPLPPEPLCANASCACGGWQLAPPRPCPKHRVPRTSQPRVCPPRPHTPCPFLPHPPSCSAPRPRRSQKGLQVVMGAAGLVHVFEAAACAAMCARRGCALQHTW